MKRAPFLRQKNMFFLGLSLHWIHLSHLTKEPDKERSPGWVMAAVYVANIISRAMCSKRINVIGLNLCLNLKNTVYALVRTRLKVNIENH